MHSTWSQNLLCAVICVMASGLSGAEMKITESDAVQNGEKVKITRYTLPMVRDEISYSVTRKADGAVTWAAIGSTVCAHGRNGGWDRWCFFRLYEKGKYAQLLTRIPAKVVYMPYQGGILADFEWPLKGGALKLRFLHTQAMQDWLFAKLQFINLNASDYDFVFNSYAGTPYLKKGGERHGKTVSNDYLLQNAFPITPEGNSFAYYNRADMEEFGNLLILETDKIAKAGFHAAKGVYWEPKADVKEILLGFSSFSNEPASTAVPRFLSEQAGTVFEALRKMDWNPRLDHSGFDALSASMKKLLAGASEAHKAEFEKIQKEYAEARSAENVSACVSLFFRLQKLNEQMSSRGLLQFQ